MSFLLCILAILYTICHISKSDPSCGNTKYSSDGNYDRRSNKYQLSIAEYNVEFLFLNSSSCTTHTLSCPGEDCRWNNDSEAISHMQYVANVINELDVDILLLVEVEDCCVLQFLYDNYLSTTLQSAYNIYLVKGTDSITGENVALLTKIDPIDDVIRYTESATYPNANSLCIDTSTSGTKTISKNLVANFSGIDNFPDFVLIGIHFLSQPSNQGRCLQREAQADVVVDIINGYDGTNYENFIVLGDFNDYDNENKDVNNHTSITNVLPFIKESITPNLINTVQFVNPQNKRYTHWPQSSFEPQKGDECGYGKEYKSYLDQYDYILLSEKLTSYIDNVTIYHNYCDVFSSDHLPIVAQLQAPYISLDYISSFGFKTSAAAYSGGNAATDVYIRLHWDKYLFQCSVYAPDEDTLYLCDATNTIQTENCEQYDINIESKYMMSIEYESTNQMFIDQIVVRDVSNNYYGVNKFCISNSETLTIGEGQGINDGNCTDGDEYLRYNEICMDDSCAERLQILFGDDPVNNNQNSYMHGVVSSITDELSNGLVCTGSPSAAPTTEMPTMTRMPTTKGPTTTMPTTSIPTTSIPTANDENMGPSTSVPDISSTDIENVQTDKSGVGCYKLRSLVLCLSMFSLLLVCL